MANLLTRPAVGPAKVKLFDSMLDNGTTIERGKVTFVGDTAKLYMYEDAAPRVPAYWDEEAQRTIPEDPGHPSRFREIDKLTDCTFEESADGRNITVYGDSEQILEEMGEVMRGDRKVRWEITVYGCEDCQ